jgi:predicted ATPase/DNA-binding CsgD family transcriptional regulator
MTATNLPVLLTSFIGRERELAEVERLVSTSRLVTLTGAGGSGKTRLALQIAHTISDAFADGVWLVDFVPLHEPGLVHQHVAQALGLRPAPNQSINELLSNFTRSKQILLILDNCEHLITACTDLAQQLLTETTALKILATSRQNLSVSGEMIYQVQGLVWPSSESATAWKDQDIMQYDAIHLFVERAQAISPHFITTPENAPAIIEICRRLDGIPLALELASARLNILTPQQIAARLDDRFALLNSGQLAPAITHHQTLRAAIDWSYDLLTPEERILLRRLAVFDAGCTLDIAESVCSGEGSVKERTIDLLSSLVDKSLVMAETGGRAEARYRLLETIREYALEKLKEAGEATTMRDRHLDFFVARAEEMAPKLQDSPYQSLWRNWLDGELDNMRSALAWSLESGRIENGLRLAVALVWYSRTRGQLLAGNWVEQLLAQADDTIAPMLRAQAFSYASYQAAFHGEAAVAATYARRAVALSEAAGEAGRPILANALIGLAMASQVNGDFASGQRITEQAITIFRELGDMYGLSITLIGQTVGELGLGNYERARTLLDEGLAVAKEMGDPHRLALAINVLGDLERFEHNYERAQAAYEQSLQRMRQIGAARDAAAVLHNLAHVHLRQGHLNQAHPLLCESMSLRKEQGDIQGLGECLIGFGAMASVGGMPAQAARLLAAAVALGGKALLTQWPAERMEYEYYLSAVRAQLTKQEFEAEQREGRAMTMEQSIEYALSLLLVPHAPASEVQDEFGRLTAREREIVALIGQGMTNGEISTQLVLSKRTVEKHVANILSKLEFTSRAQIVRWAMEHL